MKKYLIILSSFCFIFNYSNAYSVEKDLETRVITGVNADTTSYQKTENIKKSTKKDVEIIKDLSNKWEQEINNKINDLNKQKDNLAEIINTLDAKNKTFMETEKDPIATSNNYDFTTYDVPACPNDKPRLVFYKTSNKYHKKGWHCTEEITCNNMDFDDSVENNDNFSKDSAEDWQIEKGKDGNKTVVRCLRPSVKWEVTKNWHRSGYYDIRTVKCKDEEGKVYPDGSCSKPKPIEKRYNVCCTGGSNNQPCYCN